MASTRKIHTCRGALIFHVFVRFRVLDRFVKITYIFTKCSTFICTWCRSSRGKNNFFFKQYPLFSFHINTSCVWSRRHIPGSRYNMSYLLSWPVTGSRAFSSCAYPVISITTAHSIVVNFNVFIYCRRISFLPLLIFYLDFSLWNDVRIIVYDYIPTDDKSNTYIITICICIMNLRLPPFF